MRTHFSFAQVGTARRVAEELAKHNKSKIELVKMNEMRRNRSDNKASNAGTKKIKNHIKHRFKSVLSPTFKSTDVNIKDTLPYGSIFAK